MTAPAISVVVCSYNGAASIARTIQALRAQTLAPERYEILVVDDGSSDGTSDVAAAHGVRVVRQANAGLAAARNAGVDAAAAPIVAFTDDDCEPDERWLEELLRPFDDPAVAGASGRVSSATGHTLVLRYLAEREPLAALPAQLLHSSRPAYRLWLYLRGLARPDARPPAGAELYSLVGANMALRTTAIRAADGFDPAFRFGGEEEELCRRLHAVDGGTRLVYAPDALVRHHFEPGLGDTLRRARSYGKGNARTAAKHADVNLIVYPIPLAFAAALGVALARRSPRLVAAAALLPVVAYVGWPLTALRRRRPEALVYGYLQMAEEIATMRGEVLGRREGYVLDSSR